MDRVKGGYSSEAARRRFFRDYFDFHRWIRAQPIENLQYLTRQFVQAYYTHMATALIVEQWKKMTAAA